MNTVIAHREQQLGQVRAELNAMSNEFAKALPKQIPSEKFLRVVMTAIQNNPELVECERRSLLNACTKCAQDGLLPDQRQAALVVYKDKIRGKIAQYMPMIAGLRDKVRRSGEIATWETGVVHERDQWEFEMGDNPHILHRPVQGERGDVIAAYSIATLRGTGEKSREWMWREELDKVRSVAKTQMVWNEWPDEMYRKTVARRHSKVLPMSTELEQLFTRDDELSRVQTSVAPYEELHRVAPPPRSLTDQLNRIAGAEHGSVRTDASDAADDSDLDDHPDGVITDEEPAPDVSRHARALASAAKDGGLALGNAWARIPETFKPQLKDAYDKLVAEKVGATPK